MAYLVMRVVSDDICLGGVLLFMLHCLCRMDCVVIMDLRGMVESV